MENKKIQEIDKKTFEKRLDEMVKNCGKKVSEAISNCNEKATASARACYDCSVKYRKKYEERIESQMYSFRYYLINDKLHFDTIKIKDNKNDN